MANVSKGDLAIIIKSEYEQDIIGRVVKVLEWQGDELQWEVDFTGELPPSLKKQLAQAKARGLLPPYGYCIDDVCLRRIAGLSVDTDIKQDEPICEGV